MTSNVYQVNRKIALYGMIDNDTAKEVISIIEAVNDFDDAYEESQLATMTELINSGLIKSDAILGVESREPIVLEINSGGGYSSSGFSIISAIESSNTPIVGIVTGDCMSMAVPVFASCHYRISKRFAGFMIHDAQTGAEGKFNDILKTVEYLKQVRENYKNVLLEYTNIDEDKMDFIINANADYYFDPVDAKKMGIVDAIEDDVDEKDMMKKLYGIDIEVEQDTDKQDVPENQSNKIIDEKDSEKLVEVLKYFDDEGKDSKERTVVDTEF